MPSRPRPLPRARRGPLYWLGRPRRRRAATARDAIHRDEAGDACEPRLLFDGPRTKLPTATLLANGAHSRRRVDVARWLSLRWDWVRPRTVPLIAAFVGLLLTLGAVKYTALLAYDHGQPQRPRAAPVLTVPTESASRSRIRPVYQGLGCEGVACAVGCPYGAAH